MDDGLEQTTRPSATSGTPQPLQWGQMGPRSMKIVWYYVEGLWRFRNGLIHGVNEEEQREMERERLEQQASDLYDNRPEVGRRKTLFTPTKGQILRKNMQHLETWVRNVQIATKTEKRRRERVKKSKTTIRYWLVARQQNKRQRTDKPKESNTTVEEITEMMKQLTLKDTG